MSNKILDILILDDKDYWAAIVEGAISRGELPTCQTHVAMTYDEATSLIHARGKNNMFQIALLDYDLSDSKGQSRKTGYDVAVELRCQNDAASIYLVTLYDEAYLNAKHSDFRKHRLRFISKADPELESTIVREISESIEDIERDERAKNAG